MLWMLWITSNLEPLVFIRSMIQDQIGDDVHPFFMGFINKIAKIIKCPIIGVHLIKIANVVAVVIHRGAIMRRHPNRINA